MTWHVRGTELPFGHDVRDVWFDADGAAHDDPLAGSETLPGRFFLAGLVDAHAHPAITVGKSGPTADSLEGTSARLLAWAESGVTLVRDTGSPGGLTLDVAADLRHPRVSAAGRFLAPAGRYFPGLLLEPVDEAELVAAAVAEVRRGAEWVKIIGDFPHVPELGEAERTYPVEVVAATCEAVHRAGARVAVHTTLPSVRELVEAGVDSIEHGPGLDRETIDVMAARGTAWTPTCSAMLASGDDPDATTEQTDRVLQTRERLAELLPCAVASGVPVLAGTDAVGTVAGEVALLAGLGLSPEQALAAASDTARRFLGVEQRADVVTYEHDPREDPALLSAPAAVVVGGTRVR
jgi:imidazolonepropionase-like amidohydrolase